MDVVRFLEQVCGWVGVTHVQILLFSSVGSNARLCAPVCYFRENRV